MEKRESKKYDENIGGFYLTLEKNELKELKDKGIRIDFVSNPTFLLKDTFNNAKGVFDECIIWNHTIGYDLNSLENYVNIIENTFKCRVNNWSIIDHQRIVKCCTDLALNAMAERTPYKENRYINQVLKSYKMVIVACNIIKGRNIDCIVFGEAPHTYSDYIWLLAAEEMGIKTLIIQTTGFNDLTFLIDKNMKVKENNDINEREFNKKLIDDEIKKIVKRSRSGKLMHHKLAATVENRRYVISNVLKKAYQESFENSQVKPNSGIERYIDSSLNYLDFIIRNQRSYREGKIKVLFALHSEPESSNHPLSSDIGSQTILIERLAHNEKLDILIREHPLMFDMDNANVIASTDEPYINVVRDAHFRQIIERNKNLSYASHNENIMNQVRESDVFICLNGSLAFEALCFNIVTVVSKRSWVKGAPGTLTISDIESPDIKNRIKEAGQYNNEDLADFLKKQVYRYRVYGTRDYERIRTGCGSSLAKLIKDERSVRE